MATMILDRRLEERLRAERVAAGANRYDEVWEGVYMMAPMPNNEHQFLVGRFTRVLDEIVTDDGLGQVLPGANVSDRIENWEHNYRVPDVAVFLHNSSAVNHGSFWLGGPDFSIEIVSHDDQTREKLEFYGEVGTRELLIVDRDPWQLELYRLHDEQMTLCAAATSDHDDLLESQILPISLRLEPADVRPRIRVSHARKEWAI